MGSVKAVRWQQPTSTVDLVDIVRQAHENGLTVKHTFGRFPMSSEPADVVVSLAGLDRLLSYDPLKQTVTVEPGIALSHLLQRLEHYDLTLDLPGWVVDMSVGDAIATGLPSFARCVERCTVLTPGGEIKQLRWLEDDDVPSMQAVVSGLGAMGAVTTATLACVANHRHEEHATVATVAAMLSAANVGVRAHWFPLSGWCVQVAGSRVRLRNAVPAPPWVSAASAVIDAAQRLLRFLAAPIVWHVPALAGLVSAAQQLACSLRARLRSGRCFPAHALVSPRRHCAGIQWVVAGADAPALLQAVGSWARRNPRHVSTPVRLSWHGPPDRDRRPLLDPMPVRPVQPVQPVQPVRPVPAPGLVLWLDWFGPAALAHGACLPMAGLEAAMQECGGVKCWSAGPAHASALIAAGYHGYRRWQAERRRTDPSATWRSAYVVGDVGGAG